MRRQCASKASRDEDQSHGPSRICWACHGLKIFWADGQVLYSAHNLYCNSPEPGARMYQLVFASLWDSCCLQCRLVRRLVPLEKCHAVVAYIPQTT